MTKKLILISGILFLIVLTGCEGGGKFFSGISGKDRSITDVDVRKGVQGLTMEFLKNAPPESVFEGSDEDDGTGIFPIAVELSNKGAHDIKPTDITYKNEGGGDVEAIISPTLVFGFEKTYVDFDSASKQKLIAEGVMDDKGKIKFDIEGKSVFNPFGDDEFITINAKAKRIGEQSEKQPSTILATTCYPYKTIFGTSVCIDTDIYGISQGQKACSITDLNFGEGQGAPVTITKVETRMLPQGENKIKPLFLIHIENKGNGEVIKLSETEKACTKESLDYKDFNTVIISATLSGNQLDCRIEKVGEPEPAEIRLREKKGIVRCTLEPINDKVELIDTGRDAYVSPLSIELDYGYTFTISKDIIIEKILTY